MQQVSKSGQSLSSEVKYLSRSEMLELHVRVLDQVRKMTPEEGFKSMVASGIYTPDGKLAKEYGGPD